MARPSRIGSSRRCSNATGGPRRGAGDQARARHAFCVVPLAVRRNAAQRADRRRSRDAGDAGARRAGLDHGREDGRGELGAAHQNAQSGGLRALRREHLAHAGRHGGDAARQVPRRPPPARAAAERDPQRERALLKECKGIGDVGADIFCREAQLVWDELFPFADRRALQAAGRLGLDDDAGRLARRVSRKDYPRLLAALVRTGLARDFDEVLEAASH